MTEKELNGVREIQKMIRKLERHIQELRMSAENLVPILDGLPHSKQAKSRVEKLALEIAEGEHELELLNWRLLDEKARLIDLILNETLEPAVQTLLVLRYVECLSFKETARRMKYGLRHVFKLHEKIFKDGICGHIAAQNEV